MILVFNINIIIFISINIIIFILINNITLLQYLYFLFCFKS